MKSGKLRRFSLGIAVAALFSAWGLIPGHAQKTTEQFIPIGESPGLSGTHTFIGEIEQYDAGSQALTVITTSGKQTVTLTDKTRIWLDRSKRKLTSIKGSAADLQKGRRVEVKYLDTERKTGAEWIKIESAQ